MVISYKTCGAKYTHFFIFIFISRVALDKIHRLTYSLNNKNEYIFAHKNPLCQTRIDLQTFYTIAVFSNQELKRSYLYPYNITTGIVFH